MDPLVVLFEDNHCLAVAKPAPLLTQAPPGIDSLEARVRAYIKERYNKPGNVYLGIPHRLDRPVSGVVLFARQTVSAQRLHAQFKERQVRKVYRAVLEGQVQPAEGTWEDWLLKVKDESRSERVSAETPGARQAMLRYRVLGAKPEETLVELEPQTGRMHQLRVQSAGRGWPVLGDTLYGGKGALPARAPAGVIALHALALTFLHPIRYEPIAVTAPLPEWWGELGIANEAPGGDGQ
jgi:23S rRNA pseudouridine1911/1915/1917 synthase